MTPEQLARVVDAGRSAARKGTTIHPVLEAMHAELMAIADESPAVTKVTYPAPPPRPSVARLMDGGNYTGGQTIVMPAGEKIIGGQRLRLSSDGRSAFLADAVAPLFGIAVTDADKGFPVVVREIDPPEQIPRFKSEFTNGPAHPDPYQGLRTGDPDVSGGGVPYPEFPPIAPETYQRAEPVPPNEDFVAAGEPGHEQYVYSEGPLDDDVVDAVIHEVWCLGGHDEADPCPEMEKVPRTPETKVHEAHETTGGKRCWCGFPVKKTDEQLEAENRSRGEAAALLRENPAGPAGLQNRLGQQEKDRAEAARAVLDAPLSDARLTPGERMARRVGDRRRAQDAPESVPPPNGMPGGYPASRPPMTHLPPTADQQEALRRISKAVAAGGDVIVTDDKPDPNAPVHGLADHPFLQDNPMELGDRDKAFAAVQHTADRENHRVVVWFGDDQGAADSFAAWFNHHHNPGTKPLPPVAATRPQPVYDVPTDPFPAVPTYHAFCPGSGLEEHFCQICGHSQYGDQHVLAEG